MRQRSWAVSESVEEGTVLPYVSDRVCTGIHQDGKRTESVPESDKDFGCMRQTDVLSEERAGNLRIPEQPSAVGGRFGNTPTGMDGEVSGVNVLRQLVKVVVDNGEEKELQEYAVDDLKFTPRRRRDVRVTDEEMKELEGLEDNGSTEEENERPQRENRRENNRGKYRREQNDASPETDVGSESRENREKNDSGEKREYRDRSNYRGRKREYRDRNDNGEKREYRERTNYRGRNYNRDRGENADRENSGGGGEKREYRGERNFRRHRNYDRKNYQGGNNERGEQKRGDNPQS